MDLARNERIKKDGYQSRLFNDIKRISSCNTYRIRLDAVSYAS
jgi:hypothetical protein